MSSTAFTQAVAALLEHVDKPAELMSTAQHREQLDRIETLMRILPALRHQHINELAEHASAEHLGGSLRNVLADQLRIRRCEATRRIEEAADLGPRQTLTAEPLPPKLAATATAQAAGQGQRRARAHHPQLLRPAAPRRGPAGHGRRRDHADRHRRDLSPR